MKSRAVKATILGLVALFAIAGFAWACSPQPVVRGMQITGVPGATVTIEGSGFPKVATGQPEGGAPPVKISWNGLSGPQLAVVHLDGTGQFSVPVTVPPVKPGVYFLVASLDGFGVSRTPLEVTGSPDSPDSVSAVSVTSPDLWQGLEKGAVNLGRPAVEASPGNSSPVAGLALLGLGAAALTSASVLMASRRRKAMRV